MHNKVTENTLHKFCHDIQTPLATIKYSAHGIKELLPKLIDNNLLNTASQDRHIGVLHDIVNNIYKSLELIKIQLKTLLEDNIEA